MLLDGKNSAKEYEDSLRLKIDKIKEKSGRSPHLTVIMVGNNEASKTYVSSKKKACLRVGMTADIRYLEEDMKEEDLISLIESLNRNDEIDGILVQLPLPKHINESVVVNTVDPLKDVDGLTILNAGKVFTKTGGVAPATPKGIMMLLEKYNINVCGMHAVIVGRSNLVGLPIAKLLNDSDATVTLCHRQTRHLSTFTKSADLLVVAVGKKDMITKDMVKPGAIVIDVGINRMDGKLYGDVSSEVSSIASYFTPVPGGVGPMTINALLHNLLELYEVRHDC